MLLQQWSESSHEGEGKYYNLEHQWWERVSHWRSGGEIFLREARMAEQKEAVFFLSQLSELQQHPKIEHSLENKLQFNIAQRLGR